MTVIKKIGVERETLYLSSERGLCAVPFADLRTVKVAVSYTHLTLPTTERV